jgi:hypothetical protein
MRNGCRVYERQDKMITVPCKFTFMEGMGIAMEALGMQAYPPGETFPS